MYTFVWCVKLLLNLKLHSRQRNTTPDRQNQTVKSSRNIYSFISRSNLFYNFPGVYLFVKQTCFIPGGSICSLKRHKFSNTQEGLSNRHVFSKRIYLFVELRRTDLIISLPQFPRNPYLILKHKLIHANFPGAYFLIEQIHFPGSPYLVLEHQTHW